MKFIVLVALVGIAQAQVLAPLVNTGASSQFRSQDNAGNYAFGYNEDHATGGTFRREQGNAAGQVVGSYGLRTIDGRVRTVNYIADDAGFRAAIATNEPGVEPKDPADATINKAAVVVPTPVAPLLAAPAAPIVTAAPAPILAAPAPLIAPAAPVVAAAPAFAPRLFAAPAATYTQTFAAPLHGPAYGPAYAPALAPARLVAPAAPLIAQPAAPLLAPAAPLLAPAVPRAVALNSYAHPAAWGYTLGLPPTFGYTVLKKK